MELGKLPVFLSDSLVFILLYSNYLKKFCFLEDFAFPLAYFNSQFDKKSCSNEEYIKMAKYGCYYLYLLGLMELKELDGGVTVNGLGRKLIHSEDLRFRFGWVYIKFAQFVQEM